MFVRRSQLHERLARFQQNNACLSSAPHALNPCVVVVAASRRVASWPGTRCCRRTLRTHTPPFERALCAHMCATGSVYFYGSHMKFRRIYIEICSFAVSRVYRNAVAQQILQCSIHISVHAAYYSTKRDAHYSEFSTYARTKPRALSSLHIIE